MKIQLKKDIDLLSTYQKGIKSSIIGQDEESNIYLIMRTPNSFQVVIVDDVETANITAQCFIDNE